jgi:Arc/MetJ family transcription regulator
MRTNIEVTESLIDEIKHLSQAQSKQQAIEKAIEALIKYLKRREMLTLRGKVEWEGDLEVMRAD